jgi:hypothetical protein
MEEVIYSCKLTSGEEIIGKLLEINSNIWEFKDARSILMMNDGQLRLGPVLFSASKESVVEIYRPSISVMTTNIRSEFLEAYRNAVSPLSIPTKSLIMG